jgi:glycosidase
VTGIARLGGAGALTLTVMFAGCGSDTINQKNYGSPPDADLFNTGDGGGGSGYGSGSGAGPTGGEEGGPVPCPMSLEQCPEEFAYPYGGETSVSLMGAFTAGGWTTGAPMTLAGGEWQVTVPVPYAQPVEYKFLINGSNWVTDPNNPDTVTDSTGNINSVKGAITCKNPSCEEPPVPPPGVYDWRDAVIYYVFVDRFFDGDSSNNCNVSGVSSNATNYQGGDWAGVTQKINSGYFTDLGANTLWITVPFQNADTYAGVGVNGDSHYYSAYHGYWPTDLSAFEPCFGTQADLTAMITAAHANKLKILFDLVGVDVELQSSVYTSNTDWFWPNSSSGGNCICGDGCSYSDDAQICWFAPYLPHWNYTVSAAQDYSVNAAVQLIKNTGADGFRVDAVYQIPNSWFLALRSQIQSQIVATETPQQRFYMDGETYNFSDRGLIASYVNPATMLDGQFDFPLRYQLVTSILLKQQGMDALATFMDGNDNYYGVDAVMSPFIGNQDLPRSIELAQDTPLFTNPYDDGSSLAWSGQPTLPTEMSAFQRLANAFALMFTNRGAPLIYYGDEIGQPGAGDPDNRRFMPWSGLTSNQQFLYGRMKTMLAIRAAHPAFRRGIRATINVSSDVWVYSMTTTGDTVYVAMNRGDTDTTIVGLPSGSLNELITSATATGPTFLVPARETRIFVTK